MKPLCSYQGGKRRYGAVIAQHILNFSPSHVYDFGVGCGAVSIALVEAGFSPEKITAVDTGPWGDVWQAIGAGTFDLAILEALVEEVRKIPLSETKAWAENVLAKRSPSPEVFVMLQAASFGGAAVWRDGDRWRVGEGGWRYVAGGLWEPRASSTETKPRSWAISVPKLIMGVACETVPRMRGINGLRKRMEEVFIVDGAVVYIDPPYENVWGYGTKMEWQQVIDRGHRPVIVSEGKPLLGASEHIDLIPRRGGSFKGVSRGRRAEVLSIWRNGSGVFPPDGWFPHPDAPGWFHNYKEVMTEEQLKVRFR